MGDECAICKADLVSDLAALRCGHVFHYACVLQALEHRAMCPTCRKAATPNKVVSLFMSTSATQHDDDLAPDRARELALQRLRDRLAEAEARLAQQASAQAMEISQLTAELEDAQSKAVAQAERLTAEARRLRSVVCAVTLAEIEQLAAENVRLSNELGTAAERVGRLQRLEALSYLYAHMLHLFNALNAIEAFERPDMPEMEIASAVDRLRAGNLFSPAGQLTAVSRAYKWVLRRLESRQAELSEHLRTVSAERDQALRCCRRQDAKRRRTDEAAPESTGRAKAAARRNPGPTHRSPIYVPLVPVPPDTGSGPEESLPDPAYSGDDVVILDGPALGGRPSALSRRPSSFCRHGVRPDGRAGGRCAEKGRFLNHAFNGMGGSVVVFSPLLAAKAMPDR